MATLPTYIYGEVINDVLNIARARVDAMKVLTPSGFPSGAGPGMQFNEVGGGSALSTDLNADGSLILRTQIILNAAWRKFQKYLANLGYRRLIGDNLIISALPANTNPDPTIQSWLSWNGFFNGTTFTSTPALPESFYAPLKIGERISGQNAVFTPVRCALDGIRIQTRTSVLNRQWEWRDGALWLPGASGLTDLVFRYKRFLPIFTGNTSPVVPWYLQQLPIPGAASSLAWYVAYEAVFPTGEEPGATEVLQQAQDEADLIMNDQVSADQRTNCRRRPRARSSRGHGYGYGYGL